MDITVRIISAVKEETVLYDLNHPHNKCSEVIKIAWAKVAESVGVDQKTCQEYWSKLRVMYLEKIFPNKKKQQSTRSPREVRFPYTEQMMFLKEHIKPRRARLSAKETPTAIRRFIKMVKEFPILYDASDPDSKNPVKVEAIWQHIAEKLNYDAESCVITWSIFKRHYRVRIIQNDPKKNLAHKYYPYMKDLEFLRDHIVCRNPNSSENSNNLSIKLIRAVSYEPIIYHKNHLTSNDKLDEAWQNVANKIGLDDVQTCKTKWEVLKTNYLSNTNLNSNILNEMKFLKDHLSESTTAGEIDIQMEEIEEATIGESDYEDEQLQDPSTTSIEELERLIIEAVRKEPILYEKMPTTANLIKEAWARVSLQAGTDISTCIIIWRNLRKQFNDKTKTKTKFSARGRNKVPFPHTEAMGFLRKHIKSRRNTPWKQLETTPESPTDTEIQCEEQETGDSVEDIVEDTFSECKKEIELGDYEIQIESKTDDNEFLDTVCRLCFSTKDISSYLFASDSPDDEKISKIYECTGLRLCKEVDTPSPICRNCDEKLEDLWQFRALCVVNDKIYKSRQLKKQSLPLAVEEIKEEPHEFQENFMECEKKIDDEMKNENTPDIKNELFVESDEADVKCGICGNVYKNNSTLQFHVNFEHFGIQTKPPALQEAPKLPVNKKRKPPQSFICDICGKISKSKAVLKAHTEAVHLKLKPHECSICGLNFAQKSNLLKHIQIHNEDTRFACELCGMKTLTSLELETHMVSHYQRCNFCQYVAETKNDLNNHVKKVHWKETNFECKTCEKMFTSARNRDVHVISQHTKERPFKCSYCSKYFACDDYLTVHERIHTGARPVKCRICGMGFRQRSSRLNHEKKCRK